MIFSLGYSTFSADDFVDICKAANINTIIDTRSHPGSSKYPHYNKDNMAVWLNNHNVDYEWWPELGGWNTHHIEYLYFKEKYDVDVAMYLDGHFPKQRIAKAHKLNEGESGWTNYGFHDYQHYMQLDEFIDSANKLINLPNDINFAMICCEACWTRCHRSMIADYLYHIGYDVFHVTPRFRKIKKPRTVVSIKRHGDVIGTRLTRYHPDIIAKWNSR